MPEKNKFKSVVIFENEPVRRVWDEKEERWYFSVVDVVGILTSSSNHAAYWRKLKERLKKEGNESVTKCHSLKLLAKDGKMRFFYMADAETLFRLIQSIPSPKAEPFKLWLARVGYERMQETVNPELAVNRARENWQALGHSAKWIEQRLRGQEIRNKLTDYWASHQVSQEEEFAKLTNIIHKEWSGVSVSRHKKIKSLKGHNLRDHMTESELVFTSLAELSTRQVAEKDLATGYQENVAAAHTGGHFAGKARKDFEKLTGKKVVSGDNFLPPKRENKNLK